MIADARCRLLIGTQQIQVALPSGHHLSNRAHLPLTALEGEIFIANPKEYNLRQLTEVWCTHSGFTPDVAVEVTQFSMIRELIHRGLGIALLPAGPHTSSGVVYRPLAGSHFHRTIALSSATELQTPVTAMLASHIIEGHYFSTTEG